MNTSVHNLAVDMTLTNIGWFGIVGLLIVAVLIAAFVLGAKVRAHEPPPPTADSQPHLPAGGAVHEVREQREDRQPKGFPEGGLSPHQMGGYGNGGSTTHAHLEQALSEGESAVPHRGA
ncbi:DUF6479 family protein [Streptomyces sp. NBC_01298]|uniref:DUF6479 family protein n=1 Tax=Streptomyces sp. NBC_01298 TaxID=2903817 RepID=UPI002E10547A|nr:DUF6479 family protein [Streptomyces sp. NBC_01298]